MPDIDIPALLNGHRLVSDQVDNVELATILHELSSVVQREGSVVEFGCYIGTTSLFIRRLLDMSDSTLDFHVYDSFAGLPEKSSEDRSPAGEQFRQGELAASRKQFELQFKKAGLRTPRIHKGWFSELGKAAVPNNIVFAYLDGDFYGSIRDSLRCIEAKLANGAIIVVDDYANIALPGAAQAVDEWCKAQGCEVRVKASLGIIYT